MSQNLITIRNLSVHAGNKALIDSLSLKLDQGQRVTILGETGAGKSILAQAIMGLLPEELTLSGDVAVHGKSLAESSFSEIASRWGRQISLLPQEPWHSLDPVMRGGKQVSEVYQCVHGQQKELALQSAQHDLASVGLSHDAHKLPGELSGGMAQRLAFCAATAGGAELILADEPTKGLDAKRRDEVANMLAMKSKGGALLTITHDVEVARMLGGKIIVMKSGKVIEQGDAEVILENPVESYTQALIQADPRYWDDMRNADSAAAPVVIKGRGISKVRGGKQLFDQLDIDIHAGEILGLVGESGAGKSTLGDILLKQVKADAGTVEFSHGVGLTSYQKLYQDPPSAFASHVPVGVLINDLCDLHDLPRSRLETLMSRVKLDISLLERPVEKLSGGELQRLAIVRALMLKPVLLFADEPVSRLDPVTAREIIMLLCELSRDEGCALLLVSHDPLLVQRVCDRVIKLG